MPAETVPLELTASEWAEFDRLTGKHVMNPFSLTNAELRRLHKLDDRFRRSSENRPATAEEKAELDRKLLADERLTRREQAILQQGLIVGPKSRVDVRVPRQRPPRCGMVRRRTGSRPRRHRRSSRARSRSPGRSTDDPEHHHHVDLLAEVPA